MAGTGDSGFVCKTAVTELASGGGLTTITSYRDLEAWQLGMDFAQIVYALTRTYRRYVLIAFGAQAEYEIQLELAARLNLASGEQFEPVDALAARVGQVLHGLARSLPRV